MQKGMLFLVLFCISGQTIGMHTRDGEDRTFVQELFSPSAAKKARQDDSEDLIPPACFRIRQEPLQASQSREETPKVEPVPRSVSIEFNEDFWRTIQLDWPDLLGEDDLGLAVKPSLLPPLYYLMFHDNMQQKVRTLSADTKTDLLKQFFICYINESNTQEARAAQAHLFAKVPYMPIQVLNSEYVIKCNAGGGLCQHVEECGSPQFLIVQLFAHYVAAHCKSSPWPVSIEKYISNSPEEAMARLNSSKKY